MIWRFHINYIGFNDELELYGRKELPNGTFESCMPIETVAHERMKHPKEPFFRMSADEATMMLQALVDECWKHGIKPSGYDDFQRECDARGAHIEDLRRIALNSLDILLYDKKRARNETDETAQT